MLTHLVSNLVLDIKYGPTPSRLRRRERGTNARAAQSSATAENAVPKLVEIDDKEVHKTHYDEAAAQAVVESHLEFKESGNPEVSSKTPLYFSLPLLELVKIQNCCRYSIGEIQFHLEQLFKMCQGT